MKNQYQTILVTGGTGYIGSWVTKELLEKGYSVRLCLRNKNNPEKFHHLQEMSNNIADKLEIIETNLLKPGSFDDAAKGCDAIIHMASPFTLRFKDPQKDLLDPALQGTQNVLEAANRSGTVKKVVLTSSIAAVYGDNKDLKDKGLTEFTEEHFNFSSTLHHQPYSLSKVLAENEAWTIAKNQSFWKLVVVNPSFVLGPPLSSHSDSESLDLMKNILNGKFGMGAPEMAFNFVDVRDVAHAHILALENEHAEGRNIVSCTSMNMLELAGIIGKKFDHQFKLPTMKIPKFMMLLTGWIYGLKIRFICRNIGYPIRLNNTKSIKQLGLTYLPIEKTIQDMVNQMLTLKMLNPT